MMTVLKRRLLVFSLLLLPALTIHMPAAAKKEITLTAGESCMSASCHKDKATKKSVHAVTPDIGTGCVRCHQAPDASRHSFTLVAEGGALCAKCHDVLAKKENKHFPTKVGLCSFCHDPHQSDNPNLLNFPPTSELCFNCHDKNKFKGSTVHGPVKDGQCLKCHDPHGSNHAQNIRAAIPDLCFDCHDKIQKDAKGRRLPSPKRTFDNKELKQHLPFAIGQCLMCHNPHAGPNHRLLNNAYPESFYTSYSKEKYICLNCHNEKAFTEPRTMTETGFRNGSLNLHYRHVNRKKGRTCRACHHHHGAKNPKLIREHVPFGNRFITIKDFELTETGGKCGPTCHPVVRYDRYEPIQNTLKVTPRKGADATPEELQRAKQQQLKKK